MVIDSKTAQLEADLKALTDLKDDQKEVLTTLNSKHTEYLAYESEHFLSKNHFGDKKDAPNAACKSTQLTANDCKYVDKETKKICSGNTADPKYVKNPSVCDETLADPNVGVSTPDYDYAKMKTIIDTFIDKDYKYDLAQAEADTALGVYTNSNKELDAQTFSIKLICDDKKWTFTEYDDTECKKDAKELSGTWGACVQGPDGYSYIKVTGAIALKAAAAALVAFAGSQF